MSDQTTPPREMIDHAELARLCGRLRDTLLRFNMGHREEPLRNPDGPAAADALEALLAEIAALRSKWADADALASEHFVALREKQDDAQMLYHRATEAERKLAEAVEIGRSIYVYANDTLSGRVDGPDDREWQRAAVVEVRNRARHFRSKEAERG